MNDREIFLFNCAALENFSKFAGHDRTFGDDDHAAGFAVKTIHEMRMAKRGWRMEDGGPDRGFRRVSGRTDLQMQTDPADEAGHFAVLGGMTNQVGGFVHHQQLVVLVNDFEQFFHFRHLSSVQAGVSSASVKEKPQYFLPVALIVVFALSRLPGVLPQNFSAAYALAFCGGLYFPKRMAWWLPLGTLLVTDIGLNLFYYHAPLLDWYMGVKTLAFAGIVLLGRCFSPGMNFLKLLGGGLLGAILFYLITNTASWIDNPAYTKTLAGWLQALTTGVPGVHPTTWEFFRNTLMSGGLFTALFVGTMKLTAESPADKAAGAPEEETEPDKSPEEAGA